MESDPTTTDDPFADVQAEPVPAEEAEEGLGGYNPSEGEAPPDAEITEDAPPPEPDPEDVLQDPEEEDGEDDSIAEEQPEELEPPEEEPDPAEEPVVEPEPEEEPVEEPVSEMETPEMATMEEPDPEPEPEDPPPPEPETPVAPSEPVQKRTEEDEFVIGPTDDQTSPRNRNYIVFEGVSFGGRRAWIRVGQVVTRNADIARSRGFRALCQARGEVLDIDIAAVAERMFKIERRRGKLGGSIEDMTVEVPE